MRSQSAAPPPTQREKSWAENGVYAPAGRSSNEGESVGPEVGLFGFENSKHYNDVHDPRGRLVRKDRATVATFHATGGLWMRHSIWDFLEASARMGLGYYQVGISETYTYSEACGGCPTEGEEFHTESAFGGYLGLGLEAMFVVLLGVTLSGAPR